jgi:hypothetical protein
MKIVFILATLVMIALCACATPKFEDGTRATYMPIPCDNNNCGKLPDGF